MSNLREKKWVIAQVFWRVPVVDLITCFFFLLIVFNYNGSIKNYCITAPSYNPHQQLFVEKLTDNPRVIGRKLR